MISKKVIGFTVFISLSIIASVVIWNKYDTLPQTVSIKTTAQVQVEKDETTKVSKPEDRNYKAGDILFQDDHHSIQLLAITGNRIFISIKSKGLNFGMTEPMVVYIDELPGRSAMILSKVDIYLNRIYSTEGVTSMRIVPK